MTIPAKQTIDTPSEWFAYCEQVIAEGIKQIKGLGLSDIDVEAIVSAAMTRSVTGMQTDLQNAGSGAYEAIFDGTTIQQIIAQVVQQVNVEILALINASIDDMVLDAITAHVSSVVTAAVNGIIATEEANIEAAITAFANSFSLDYPVGLILMFVERKNQFWTQKGENFLHNGSGTISGNGSNSYGILDNSGSYFYYAGTTEPASYDLIRTDGSVEEDPTVTVVEVEDDGKVIGYQLSVSNMATALYLLVPGSAYAGVKIPGGYFPAGMIVDGDVYNGVLFSGSKAYGPYPIASLSKITRATDIRPVGNNQWMYLGQGAWATETNI